MPKADKLLVKMEGMDAGPEVPTITVALFTAHNQLWVSIEQDGDEIILQVDGVEFLAKQLAHFRERWYTQHEGKLDPTEKAPKDPA